MKLERLNGWLDLRKSLIVIVLCVAVMALNSRWHNTLKKSLEEKREELGESLALLDSNPQVQEQEMESFKTMKANQAEAKNWTDSIAPLVAEQKLILRQVRPLGIEQRGKIKEEKLFLQVEGNVDGLLGLLHYIGLQELPVYVSRYMIISRAVGSGFISVELELVRVVV